MTAVARTGTAPAPAERMGHARSWLIDIDGVSRADLHPIKWQFYLSLTGLFLGLVMGLLQALERLDVNLYNEVGLETYYQGLTLHGVGLAIVFTFTFGNSFLSLATMRGYGRPLASRAVSNLSLYLAAGGVGLALWAILANKATVLFTFYAPMKATPAFYLGATLLVVSTWMVLLNMVLTYRQWRKEHRKERIPLLSFTSLMTYVMWTIASVGIAAEVLIFLVPFSFGWTDTIDPQFTRLLFWFTGHPIVYFWLLPVYVSWYLMLPKMVGGRQFSDGLIRVVFIAFLVLIPVGIHHQYTDPAIPFHSKSISWILTFAIFFPSTLTLFSVVASLEDGARKNGGTGWLKWILKLPWGDPAVAGQLLAGIGFMLGGASGLINASFTVNTVVHNTAFIPGHFHLTVGTAVALSIMAIAYWLIPYLTGKELWGRRVGVAQVWLWIVGVFTFSRGQMMGGLEGMPRRTQISDAPYLADHPGWDLSNLLTGIGGSIMFVSGVLFFLVVFMTINNRQVVTTKRVVPVAEVENGSKASWPILDQIWVWISIAVLLSVLVYGEVIYHYWPLNSVARGVKVW
jgi:cytochrome c oxidase subunit 1